jgi:hypothetical protein
LAWREGCGPEGFVASCRSGNSLGGWFGLVIAVIVGTALAFVGSEWAFLGVAVAALVGYRALAAIVDRMTIVLNREKLAVVHAPLPLPGSRFSVKEVARFAAAAAITKDDEGQDEVDHFVQAVNIAGGETRLKSFAYGDRAHAAFVAHRLNEGLARLRERSAGYRVAAHVASEPGEKPADVEPATHAAHAAPRRRESDLRP